MCASRRWYVFHALQPTLACSSRTRRRGPPHTVKASRPVSGSRIDRTRVCRDQSPVLVREANCSRALPTIGRRKSVVGGEAPICCHCITLPVEADVQTSIACNHYHVLPAMDWNQCYPRKLVEKKENLDPANVSSTTPLKSLTASDWDPILYLCSPPES